MVPSEPDRRRGARARGALTAVALAVAACAAERERPTPDPCPTWRDDVEEALRACAGCHDLDDYADALAAKDAMVAALDPAAADDTHRPFADTHPVIARWAACGAPYFRSALHPGGIHDPASPDFHGAELARRGWDLRACATCHGDDFAGGTADASCRTCHDGDDGPAACDTCHAAEPTTAAHPTHTARAACADCHVVPAAWDAPGHVLGDAAPAEATGYDGATGTCTVACHGDARPRWTGGPAEAACGTCHGAPPADHAWDRCETCHPTDAPHVDLVVQVGRTAGCDGCHGDAGDPAPPIDLDGDRFTPARGVGAHQSHLRASSKLGVPVPCAACHVVPATTGALGHLDTAPPAEVVAGAGWDPATGTCTNACHGAAAPRWTRVGAGEAACGTCHGVPPASHDPTQTIADCVQCHPALPDRHVDGVLDVDP